MTSRFDFRRRAAPPLLGWALLFAGSAALGACLWAEERLATERASVDEALQLRLDADRRRQEPVRKPPPTPADLRRQAAESEARQPWLPTLRAIEGVTQDPVYLRSMAIEPAAGNVKLEAEAPTFVQALAYVEALAGEPMFSQALLVSHAVLADPATGKETVHFTVAAQWNRR